MNLRTTLILFGVLVAGLGVFLALQLLGIGTTEEREELSRYVLPSLNRPGARVLPAEVDQVQVERPDPAAPDRRQSFTLKREGKGWKLTAPRELRVSEGAVDNLVRQIIELPRERLDPGREGLAALGLDQPSIIVTLSHRGQSASLKVGKQGLGGTDPTYFVVSSDAPDRPVAIRKSRVEALFAPLADLREKRLITSSFGAKQVKLAGKSRELLELEKTSETSWVFRQPALGEADLGAATGFATELAAASVESSSDFIYDGPLDDAVLAKYGLKADEAAFVLTLTQTAVGDEQKLITETLYVGARDGGQAERRAQYSQASALLAGLAGGQSPVLALAVGMGLGEQVQSAEKKAAGYFARRQGEDAIVRLPARFVTILERKADEFRSKALAKIDVPKVDAINLTSGGETLRFRQLGKLSDERSPDAWDLFTDSRARVKAHPGTVQKLLDALNKIELGSAAGFLDDEPRQRAWFGTEPVDLGLDQPQAEIAIWYEGLVRDAEGKATGEGEPKLKDDQKATPRLKFSLGRSDAKRGVVYVRREAVGAPPAILAIPDPWQGQAPPPPSFPGQPPMPTAQPAPISLTSLVGGGYLAYRERLLPSFRPDLAAKLTLKRGTDVYELAKEEKKDEQGATKAVWNVTQPVAGVSQNADVMLFSLVGLSADKLVTDRPTERDLNEKFGLGDNALLRIHVVTKPDEQQRVAQFTWLVGQATDADAKHPNHHYVRLISQPVDGSKPEANDFVFLVDRQQLLGCDQELRDPHIFPPAAARPTGATFTWRTVDAEKKLTQTQAEVGLGDDGKTWVVRSVTVDGADAKDRLPALDQAKLNMMFGMDEQGMSLALPGVPRLNNLYTERFLVHQGPPTPEQQLDPARADAPPPLQVEIKFADGSTRLLTLGARFELTQPQHVSLRGQTFFPATSSTVPQAVFTLSLADFKGLVDEGLNFLRPPGPLGSASSQ